MSENESKLQLKLSNWSTLIFVAFVNFKTKNSWEMAIFFFFPCVYLRKIFPLHIWLGMPLCMSAFKMSSNFPGLLGKKDSASSWRSLTPASFSRVPNTFYNEDHSSEHTFGSLIFCPDILPSRALYVLLQIHLSPLCYRYWDLSSRARISHPCLHPSHQLPPDLSLRCPVVDSNSMCAQWKGLIFSPPPSLPWPAVCPQPTVPFLSLSLSHCRGGQASSHFLSALSSVLHLCARYTFCILSRPPAPLFSTILSPVVQVYNSMYSASVHESPVSCQAL